MKNNQLAIAALALTALVGSNLFGDAAPVQVKKVSTGSVGVKLDTVPAAYSADGKERMRGYGYVDVLPNSSEEYSRFDVPDVQNQKPIVITSSGKTFYLYRIGNWLNLTSSAPSRAAELTISVDNNGIPSVTITKNAS